LAVKSMDPPASKIQGDAQEGQQCQDALNAAQLALKKEDYAEAAKHADAALRIKPKEPEATKVKLLAQQGQSYQQATRAFKQGAYVAAMSQCQPFLGTERFDQLSQQIGQEQRQLQGLQKALNDGSYATILGKSWPNKPDFESVRAIAAEENRALEQARQKLAAGDYGYLETIEQRSYKTKPPFADVLQAGRKESEALILLRKSQEANDRAGVRNELAKLSPEARNKVPFAELDKWAQSPGNLPIQVAAPPIPANVARLENVLRSLEIRFGTKEPDSTVLDHDGNPVTRETNISKAKRVEASAKVRYLREYRENGWLTEERKARLQKVEDAIRNSKD